MLCEETDLFDVFIEPIADVAKAGDAAVCAACAREAVEFIREADEFGVNAEAFEGNAAVVNRPARGDLRDAVHNQFVFGKMADHENIGVRVHMVSFFDVNPSDLTVCHPEDLDIRSSSSSSITRFFAFAALRLRMTTPLVKIRETVRWSVSFFLVYFSAPGRTRALQSKRPTGT